MKKAIIATSDDGDWDGLYIHGEFITEGHSINLRDVLEHFGYELEYRQVDGMWLEREGLPTKLEDVRWE